MTRTAEHDQWVKDALGVTVGTGAPANAETSPLLPIWLDAKMAIDAQITQMQKALKATGNPVAAQIADRGIVGLTRKWDVKLLPALSVYDDADPAARQAAGEKLKQACGATLSELGQNKLIDALEENPFGVGVTIKATMQNTLAAITQHLGLGT